MKYSASISPRRRHGIAAAEKISEMRKMRRILGLLSAMTIVGMMTIMVMTRTQIRGSLLRNMSLEIVETIADWRLSKTVRGVND